VIQENAKAWENIHVEALEAGNHALRTQRDPRERQGVGKHLRRGAKCRKQRTSDPARRKRTPRRGGNIHVEALEAGNDARERRVEFESAIATNIDDRKAAEVGQRRRKTGQAVAAGAKYAQLRQRSDPRLQRLHTVLPSGKSLCSEL